MITRIPTAALAVFVFAFGAQAHDTAHSSAPRADAHAPIGVMGDHRHKAGEWMLSYRYMHMDMGGMRDGTTQLTTAEVLDDYMVTPTAMTMDMQMLGVMYAPHDRVTVMAMVPYVTKDMDLVTRMGIAFTTRSEGVGDVKLTALVGLLNGRHRLHFNAGVSLPTGSTDERDDTPAMANARLPYPMQIGSGTFDLLPGLTYTGYSQDWSWGAQVSGVVRLGDNDEGYSLGDRVDVTAWAARPLTRWLSGSLRLAYARWGNVDGADPALNPMMAPTADPDNQGGKRVDIVVGVNLLAPKGALKGHRLAVEVTLPLHQDVNGPQMESDWALTIGWQKAL